MVGLAVVRISGDPGSVVVVPDGQKWSSAVAVDGSLGPKGEEEVKEAENAKEVDETEEAKGREETKDVENLEKVGEAEKTEEATADTKEVGEAEEAEEV